MERVIAVGVQLGHESAKEATASFEELARLIQTAGGQWAGSLTQKRPRPDPALYIGKGKAEELRGLVRMERAQTIVFDSELKPNQQRALEEITQAKIVDRTRLILDIFAQRARTREGKLQVELAQLSYLLPRLTERFGRFEQQTGGIGTRGPGERKLEVDRRRLRDRMAALKEDLEKVRRQRDQQRAVRRSVPIPQVALMGYTNTGKSTLLNALVSVYSGSSKSKEPQVYADDKLFATLDPTTRRVRLPSGRIVLFTDTVGFIRKLPTELVAAFRATLEETAAASLLVHVVDASDPDWNEQAQTVLRIVRDLQMDQLPVLTAYNKMDRLSPSQIESFSAEGGIVLSASKKQGLHEFLSRVEGDIFK
jgi:GTPase